MNQSKRERIAARAYEIWEREGRPANKNEEHWRRAEQELAAEESTAQMGGSGEGAQARDLDTRLLDAASPLSGDKKTAAEGAKQPKRKTASGRPRSRKPPQQG